MIVAPAPGYLAFADESFTSSGAIPDVYMFAGLLIEPAQADAVRDRIEKLRMPQQKKVHWHGDTDARHDQIMGAISTLSLEAILLVRTGSGVERDERRRRKALAPFIAELEQYGCTDLTLESRGARADGFDRHLLDTLRSQRHVSGLRIHHQPGPLEPLLAIPDAICGAYNATLHGTARWWDAVAPRTHLIEVRES